MDFTASGLLANIRRVGSIPTSVSAGNTDTDLLRHINDELQLTIPAKLISVREGFFRTTKDHALVSGTTRYRLPYRAIASRLDSATLVDSLGNTLRKLNEIPDSRLAELYNASDTAGFRVEAGDLVLVPGSPIANAITLRMRYYIRPNQVTTSLDAAVGLCFTVTAIDTLTKDVTILSGHGLTANSKLDIVKGTPPFEHLQVDVYPTSAATGTVALASVAGLEVGDFVCQSEYAPVAQVPDVFYPLLTHLVALKYALAKGDEESVKAFESLLPKLEKEAVALIAPRVEEGAKKTMSNFGAVGSVGNGIRRIWGL